MVLESPVQEASGGGRRARPGGGSSRDGSDGRRRRKIIDKARPGAMLQPAPPLSQECGEATVSGALLLMEQNLNSPLSVSTIARRLNLSTRSLQRSFRKHLGHGPQAAYMRLRLKHALWMLRDRVPIIDAATETGFATAAAFSAAYKREYGHTPSAARGHWPPAANPSLLARLESDRRIFEVPYEQS